MELPWVEYRRERAFDPVDTHHRLPKPKDPAKLPLLNAQDTNRVVISAWIDEALAGVEIIWKLANDRNVQPSPTHGLSLLAYEMQQQLEMWVVFSYQLARMRVNVWNNNWHKAMGCMCSWKSLTCKDASVPNSDNEANFHLGAHPIWSRTMHQLRTRYWWCGNWRLEFREYELKSVHIHWNIFRAQWFHNFHFR